MKMMVGEGSDEYHGTHPDESSSTGTALKGSRCTNEHGPNFIDDADKAYIILLNVFCYLSRKDLLSAMRVCKVWNIVGSDKIFWKEISLGAWREKYNNTIVQNLKKFGTEKIKFSDSNLLQNELSTVCQALSEVTTLTEITVEWIHPYIVTLLAKGLPHLKSLCAYSEKRANFFVESDDIVDISPLKNMKMLKTLKLINCGRKKLIFNDSDSDSTYKIELNLTTLAITRTINLCCIEHILPSTLVSLELEECDSLSYDFLDILLKLVSLTRLRLVKCYDAHLTTKLVEKISKLPNLSDLELVNFDISQKGFEKNISECTNLKSLLIVPVYKIIHKPLHPLCNLMILNGVSRLKNSLKVFIWVVTDEMFTVFDAQFYYFSNLVSPGNSIPVQRDGGVDFILYDDIQSRLWPELKFAVFRRRFSFTWKLSFSSFKYAKFL